MGNVEAPAEGICDLTTVCSECGEQMIAEGAHYRCPNCGWRDSCCF